MSRQRVLGSMVLLVGLVGAVPWATAQSPSCCSPQAEEDTWWSAAISNPEEFPQIRSDERDGVYVLFPAFQGDPRMYLAVSRDAGSSWDLPHNLGFSSLATPVWDASPDGRLLLLYNLGGPFIAVTSPNQGIDYNGPFPLERPVDLPSGLDLGMDPSGLAVAAWWHTISPDGNEGIWYMVSEDHGQTWTPISRLPDSETYGGVHELHVLAEDGAILLAWIMDQGGQTHAWTRRSGDAGVTWSPLARVDNTPGDSTEVPHRLYPAYADGGNLAMGYLAAPANPSVLEYEIRVTTSQDGGLGWSGQDAILGRTAGAEATQLLATRDASMFLLWIESGGSAPSLQISRDLGLPGTWLASAAQPAPDGVESHHFRLAVSSDGIPFTIHDDYRDDGGPDCDITRCESIYLDRSCDDGASWLQPELRLDSDAAPHSVHSEDPTPLASGAGAVHAVWTDFANDGFEIPRVRHRRISLTGGGPVPRILVELLDEGGACEPPVYRLSADPSSLGGCLRPTYQWLRDGVEIAGAGGSEYLPAAAFGPATDVYQFRLTCDPPRDCGNLSATATLSLPVGPSLSITEDRSPASACERSAHRFAADAGALPACTNASLAWILDGSPVAGATDLIFDAGTSLAEGNHRIQAEWTCDDPVCNVTSGTLDFTVAPPFATPPTTPIQGSLRVAADLPELEMAWEDTSSLPMGYNIYEGVLGAWYDHAGKECGVLRLPPGATSLSRRLTPGNGDRYFLVSPANCNGEGTVGRDSNGNDRPVAGSGPACGPVP